MRCEDLSGRRFGRLLVVSRTENLSSRTRWLVLCDCGNRKEVYGVNLRRGLSKSCGCGISKMKDISGMRFGSLTVVKVSGRQAGRGFLWLCRCDCGEEITVNKHSLSSGNTKSCGCVKPGCRKDLSGKRFGKLVAVEPVGSNKNKSVVWRCACDCGSEINIAAKDFNYGNAVSCGCSKGLAPGEALTRRELGRYKWGAINRNLEWSLSGEQARQLFLSDCHYCGTKPNRKIVDLRHKGSATLNGIDRVDPKSGYVKGNVVPCCKTCNYAKHVMSKEDFTSWIKRAHNHLFGTTQSSAVA